MKSTPPTWPKSAFPPGAENLPLPHPETIHRAWVLPLGGNPLAIAAQKAAHTLLIYGFYG
jgi:hypothetical protein